MRRPPEPHGDGLSTRPGVAASGQRRPSPLDFLRGRWAVDGDGAGTLVAKDCLHHGWLRLVPDVQFDAAPGQEAPLTYTRALYVTWSATENCFVRLGPATDASYVLTRCPGWTGHQLVWEGFAYNDHGVAQKGVRTIYEDMGDDAMQITEQVDASTHFDTVATFRLQRECPARALDYFDGVWQVKGYSEDADGRPCLFDARLTSAPHVDGAALSIDGTLGDQPYHGEFVQGYDASRGLYFNRTAQSTGMHAVGWSDGWEDDHFDWRLTLAASGTQPERRLHIERRRLGADRFEITERVHDGHVWRTFGQKTATRVARP